MSTGDDIGNLILEGDKAIAPFIKTLDPGIGEGVDLALKLLAKAEPAVYNAVVVFLQGKELTPEQQTAKNDAIARLQNPDEYFAD